VAVDSDAEIDGAIGDLAREPSAIIVVLPDAFMATHRDVIVSSARRYNVPAVCPYRFFAEAGCPLSYGLVNDEMFLGAASYVDRILRGAKPADLPVQAPTRFEMIINLKAAKGLGLAIPPSLLARADELIERAADFCCSWQIPLNGCLWRKAAGRGGGVSNYVIDFTKPAIRDRSTSSDGMSMSRATYPPISF